jgi:eukaryotic-like serine/threonine-protein kinase
MIGERLGPYTVLAKIGRGGMGTVYLASDTRGERVALKVLDATVDGEAGLKRFAQELDLLRRADHPRIVRALGGLERSGPHAFFAMEYVRGRNLTQVLAEVGRLEPQDALKLAAEALEGLAAAHAAGVLHRDVKSANLLLDETGSVKVCDFGLARACSGDA